MAVAGPYGWLWSVGPPGDGTLRVSRQRLPGWSSFGSGFSSELERRSLLAHKRPAQT